LYTTYMPYEGGTVRDARARPGRPVAAPRGSAPALRLERIHHRSLRDRVVVAIRNAIIRGAFRPGEKVPEQDLADELGVSRTPIREAIRILEQQGLVETRPKSGTFIARVDRRDVRDGLLLRTELEQLAVRQAMERMDEREWDELCARLQGLVEGMAEAVDRGDPVAATELDIEFHTTLIEAAGNRYLSQAWRLVGLPFLIWSPEREIYPQSREAWTEWSTGRHGELLEALRTRDPEACAAGVRSHIARKLLDLEGELPEGHVGAGEAKQSSGTSGEGGMEG
jgi:DNA-binding GntR family transcriptional regulator